MEASPQRRRDPELRAARERLDDDGAPSSVTQQGKERRAPRGTFTVREPSDGPDPNEAELGGEG